MCGRQSSAAGYSSGVRLACSLAHASASIVQFSQNRDAFSESWSCFLKFIAFSLKYLQIDTSYPLENSHRRILESWSVPSCRKPSQPQTKQPDMKTPLRAFLALAMLLPVFASGLHAATTLRISTSQLTPESKYQIIFDRADYFC